MNLRSFQAVTTKYLGPTNVRGSRIKATCSATSITIDIDHALNIEENHAAAAKALLRKMDWRGEWHMGGLPDDHGYCFVCADTAPAFVTVCKARDYSKRAA